MAKKEQISPWLPVEYEVADAAAIQAMAEGVAEPEQQKRVLKWIIERAAGTYDQSFYPGGEEGRRNSDFAEGRRFVGNSIVKMLRVNISSMRRREE